MIATLSALSVLLFAIALFGAMWFVLTEPVVIPVVVPGEPYRPRHYERLPKRPEGRQALKAEILLAVDADPVLIPAPPVHLHVRREHDDWRFDTDEFQIAWDAFFDGEPEDEALQRTWTGNGRVAIQYAEVTS